MKNGLPYYKRYPRDFIEGTVGMRYEVKGIYAILLDLIYLHGGRCPDDAAYISVICGCSKRLWRAAREELLRLEKVIEVDGFLTNFRAENELKSLRKFAEKQMEIARKPRPTRVKSKTSASQNLANQNQIQNIPLSLHSRGIAAPDVLLRKEDLWAALGEHQNQRANFRFMSFEEPINWTTNGCDIDLDVIPTLQRLSAKSRRPITGWGYFSAAVFEARDRRTAPPPVDSQRPKLANGSGEAYRPAGKISLAEAGVRMLQRMEQSENGEDHVAISPD